MEENFIGYLLGALDDGDRRQVASYLQDSPEARGRLERLERALQPLAWDAEPPAPPEGLAERTLAFVRENSYEDLPVAPETPAGRLLGVSRIFFGRLDMLVAACLLLTALGVGVCWAYHVHLVHRQLQCQQDLVDLYTGADAYRMNHGRFPNVCDVTADDDRKTAGLIVPMLIAEGYVPKEFKFHCASGEKMYPIVKYEDALKMDLDQFKKVAGEITPYGYALGYRGPQGVFCGPDYHPGDAASSTLALMADAPPAEYDVWANSPNHGGFGQNVMYMDGSLKFKKTRQAGYKGDDIFLNKLGKIDLGQDPFDTVIAPGWAKGK